MLKKAKNAVRRPCLFIIHIKPQKAIDKLLKSVGQFVKAQFEAFNELFNKKIGLRKL